MSHIPSAQVLEYEQVQTNSQKELKMFSKPSFRMTIVVLVLGVTLVSLAFVNRESGKRAAFAPAAAVSSRLIFQGRGGGGAQSQAGVTDPVVLKELAQVRQATAKYQDVNVALADGFIATPNCVSDPKLGGMGIHYINPARLMDPAVNILEPEILLYSQTADGMKLLGVEYMFAIGAPDTHVPNPAPLSPVIFGRSLDGPMEQHEPGQPPHYDLHVWIWKANPAGIFAMFNPKVSCP
jgi:hypothetical protein